MADRRQPPGPILGLGVSHRPVAPEIKFATDSALERRGFGVAIISDARLGARADQHAITERLLSITGEDAITIDRKYLPAWTGQLQTRFIIISNELPRLADASGALASRKRGRAKTASVAALAAP